MSLLTRNFKNFFKKKIRANTSRRNEEERKEMRSLRKRRKTPGTRSNATNIKGLDM